MTNKEHLSTLDAESWWKRVDWLYHIYGKSFNNTRLAVIEWVDKEYKPVKPMRMNHNGTTLCYCSICCSPIFKNTEQCPQCLTDVDWTEDNV